MRQQQEYDVTYNAYLTNKTHELLFIGADPETSAALISEKVGIEIKLKLRHGILKI
jgi:hypothetical protein